MPYGTLHMVGEKRKREGEGETGVRERERESFGVALKLRNLRTFRFMPPTLLMFCLCFWC